MPAQPVLGTDPLPIIWKGEPEYEEARVGRVFNLRRPKRYPVAVLEARDVSDVIRGVNLARERNLQVALRSGGHSWAAWSVRSQSLLIDLGKMRELSFDPATNIATASPAITGGELNPLLSRYGQFFAGGHCPTVGIGGFLLQGGQGWWARGLGWSAESIESIDVVLPSGELVTASEKENADLFWAARGSGPGFFGVVVRFRLRTRPRPLDMHHVTYIMPAKANFRNVIVWLQNACRTELGPEVEVVCLAFTRGRLFGDAVTPNQDPMESMLVIRGTSNTDSEAEARKVLAPLLKCPGADTAEVKVEIAPTSMPEEYARQLEDNPPGQYFLGNSWLTGEAEDIADTLEEAFTTLPSRESFYLYYNMAPLRPLTDMCFTLQSEHYTAGYIISTGEDEAEQARCHEWLSNQMAYVDSKQDGSGGTIGMYLGDSDLAHRSGRIMSDEAWDKWVKIRDQYDPKHMFVGFLHGEHLLNKAAWEQPNYVPYTKAANGTK